MKRVSTSNISSSVGQPVRKATLDTYNEAIKENSEDLVKALLTDATGAWILYGVVNSGSGSNYIYSAGAIYYNGEIYRVDAATFSTTGMQVPVATITTTYNASDPTILTDSSPVNVHEIRKIVLSAANSGSGDFNMSSAKYLQKYFPKSTDVKLNTKVVTITNWNMDTTALKDVAHGLSDITKIRAVDVWIQNDAADKVYPLNRPVVGDIKYIYEIDSTNVRMERETGGAFDSTDFDGTGDRGWVTITYEESL